MLFILFACSTPEKLATEHSNIFCTYLEECQLLQVFEYDTTDSCLSDSTPLPSEDTQQLLIDCTDSLQEADCNAVYAQEYYITEACTSWENAALQQASSQEE